MFSKNRKFVKLRLSHEGGILETLAELVNGFLADSDRRLV